MKIIEKIAVNNPCYKAGRNINIQGIILHSVGCPQPSAEVFANIWNLANANVCVHAVVDARGNTYQLLPWNHRGWHAGGSANNTHIGVEMTEPSTIRYTSGANWIEIADGKNTKNHILATYNNAVELFAYLCKKYNLDPLKDGVIISHSEGYKRGVASAHADVEHIWSKFGLTMNQFRKDVYAAINSNKVTVQITSNSYDWISKLQEECNKQGFSNQVIDGIAGPNTLAGCPQIKYGASGNITKILQERLNNLGYNCGVVDGIFGNKTKVAVTKFQKDKKLVVDGIVGQNTWRKLLDL